MTLKEMKQKTFSLIEEYYPENNKMAEDEDVLNKINGVINQIQLDLMKYRKLTANIEIEVEENDDKIINLKDYIEDLYQLNKIYFGEDYDEHIDYDMLDDSTIKLPSDYIGIFNVYYYKYPELVELNPTDNNYDNTYEFELDNALLEIMPYGIAADLLKMDMISNYGKYFYERYLEMKNNIDSRKTSGIINITGGIDI